MDLHVVSDDREPVGQLLGRLDGYDDVAVATTLARLVCCSTAVSSDGSVHVVTTALYFNESSGELVSRWRWRWR